MKKKETTDLRLDPKARLCPLYDEKSIRMIPLPEPEEMGMRVLDNCHEEHIQ